MPLARTRISTWLTWYAATPLRYLWACSGAGKTTAAALYARTSPNSVRYVRVPTTGSFEDVLDAFSKSFGASIGSEADLFDAFPSGEPLEVVLDDVHHADEETRDILQRLPEELPHTVTLTYLSQTGNAVDIIRPVSSGTAVVADMSLFNFTSNEVADYCEALRVPFSPADVAQLLYATDGWSFAVTGAIREAGSAGHSLRGAYERWAERHQLLLAEMASRSLVGLNADERHAAERLYAGENFSNSAMFGRLQNSRLLFATAGGELRPLRPFLSAAKRNGPATESFSAAAVPTASLELFGEFEMVIDGRKVDWCRRRDRQIIEFLALRPDGRATRAEVIEAFWPDADAHLAGQSLRTACSTIRRAIAQCVGYDRVGNYFTVNRELNLHMEHIVTTARRFREHIHAAGEAASRGELTTARAHYTSALRIYRAPLLNGEGPPAPWFAAAAEMFATMGTMAREGLDVPPPNRRPEYDAVPSALTA